MAEASGGGVRWSLDGLFASAADAREHAERALADARSFAERWSGRLADLDGATFAVALAELADLRAARQEAEYYHYLAESTDSENAEIRDLGAWLEPRLTEIANVIRGFELAWIGLPADTAERLLAAPEVAGEAHAAEQAPPFRPVHAVGARGAAAQRARRDGAQGLADALQPARVDADDRLRRRRRIGAAHRLPAHVLPRLPRPGPAPASQRGAARARRAGAAGPGAVLRHDRRRQAAARPAPGLSRADAAHEPRERAGDRRGAGDARRGRSRVSARAAVVARESALPGAARALVLRHQGAAGDTEPILWPEAVELATAAFDGSRPSSPRSRSGSSTSAASMPSRAAASTAEPSAPASASGRPRTCS